ncbi:hypothetical protein HQ531_08130 [bacterium]|nr:hypothetical protein [bacterium]
MADKSASNKQGRRYSVEEKAEIAQFIKAFNEKNKRGGMKAASEKFGVSAVTLSNWAKKTKGPKKRKPALKAKVKKAAGTKVNSKRGSKALTEPAASDQNPDAILIRLQAIRTEVVSLEKEFNALKKKL